MKYILDYYYNKFNKKELEIDKYTFNPGTSVGHDLIFLFNNHFKERNKDTWLINNSFEFALILSKYKLDYKEYEKELVDNYPFIITFYYRPENFIIYGSIYNFIIFPYINFGELTEW